MAMMGVSALGSAQGFSDQEKAKIMAFWSAPERYQARTPEAIKNAPFQVRLSTEGSLWLWSLDRKRGLAKGEKATGEEDRDWDAWIDAKVSYDRWSATVAANRQNRALGFSVPADPAMPAAPGPIPVALQYLVGDAPNLATTVQPKTHRIEFSADEAFDLTDNPSLAAKNQFYRFADGVRHFGTQVKTLPDAELNGLLALAGISEGEKRVFSAVSLLEGGFESVNTYDTGYVSVGFIQFACLGKGSGSLGQVLLTQKRTQPAEFEADFRRFGVDVTGDGALVALNVATGQVVTGYDAARQIIADKRLIAVFHRAGSKSSAFRVAQLRVAKDQYFPASDVVKLTLGGQEVNARVSSFIKSEAGLATLMDRKVHTGSLGNLAAVTNRIALQNGLNSLDDLVTYEADIIRELKHRKNYLGDETLSQPVIRAAKKSVPKKSSAPKKSKKKD